MKSSLLNSASIGSIVLAGMFFSAPAFAQSSGSDAIEQVTVTGSRVSSVNGFQTPTPVTSISPLQYDVKQITNLADIENDMPSLTPNQNQSSVINPAASNFNLRNIGTLRTLVLVNGLRTEPTSIDQTFDVNSLPAALVQRIDVVTGGASAGYGSDAVAGIVNVVLNTTLDGFKGNIGSGVSYYGDNKTVNASAAYGTSFDGGRGHFVIGGDYAHNAGILEQDDRPWGRQAWGIATNSACTTLSSSCTNLYLSQNIRAGAMSDGGVITAGPLKGIQFGPGGVVQQFHYGAFPSSSYMVGGDGSQANLYDNLQPTTGHANVLGYLTYDFSNDVSGWFQMLYAKSTSFVDILPAVQSGNITVTNQNAYLPAAVLALMTANHVTSITLGRSMVDLAPLDHGFDQVNGYISDYDPSAGIKGKFDALGSTWNWDLSAQYADNYYKDSVGQNLRTDLFNLSVDSELNPSVGGVAGVPVGTPICRSTIANPTNGCVPVDLFGTNTVTPAATQYLTGTNYVVAKMNMMDFAANMKSVPFQDWAGPVSIAFGAEYRRQAMRTFTDSFSAAFDWSQANNSPYAGAYSVEEGYFEADVPVLKGIPLVELIDIDSAIRLTSYSTSGGTTTWKVGANWSVTDDLRLRGVRSHDIRAPNLQELFQGPLLRCCGTTTNPNASGVSFQTSGNPNLVPEVGDTISGGMVYTPEWLSNFNISIDYWKIKLTKQIVAPSTQNIVNNCYSAGIAAYCALITPTPPATTVTLVQQPTVNAASLETDGVDFEASYKFDLSDLFAKLGGQVQLHFLGTYLGSYNTNAFGLDIDSAGTTGTASLPRFKSNITAIYLNGPWTFTFSGNYTSDGFYNNIYNNPEYTFAEGGRTINNNNVPSRFYVNLTASYQWTDTWQVYVRLNNALNNAPPAIPDTRPFPGVVGSSALFDRNGGQATVGVKISLN